ncbi:hypothetical protein A9Q89_09075 [Gammaproteobacteria bacterium 53_120_T64]|nr:hypothetical protein A9Q89_09075 [Gammaproteobacteria bacterium 53_120_T64]
MEAWDVAYLKVGSRTMDSPIVKCSVLAVKENMCNTRVLERACRVFLLKFCDNMVRRVPYIGALVKWSMMNKGD